MVNKNYASGKVLHQQEGGLKIYFITSNIGKLRELQTAFRPLDIEVVAKDVPHPELQASSLEEVVEFKVEYLRVRVRGKFIVDDSGLLIKSLNDFPGVYSSYVFNTLGCEGILTLLEDKENRDAMFQCCLGYCDETSWQLFTGICEGEISKNKRGEGGFGYDPIFVPKGSKKTFAEMSTEEKNRVSHRGKAIRDVVKFLRKWGHKEIYIP